MSISLIVFEIFAENMLYDLSRSEVIIVNQSWRWLSIVIIMMDDLLNELFFIYKQQNAWFCHFDLLGSSKVKGHSIKKSQYMISYMSIMQTKSLSLLVFEIFEKNMWYDLSRSEVLFVNQSLRRLFIIVIMTDDFIQLCFKTQ